MTGKFTFHAGDYSPNAAYLFNERKHLMLQSEQDWKCFYVLNNKQFCVAFLWVHINNEIASSPIKAPFASVEFADNLAPKVLFDFLIYIQNELKTLSVKKIIFKNAPDVYESSKCALINVLLHNMGFYVSHAEVSSVIKVNDAAYGTHTTQWELRKLKQAKTKGFCFTQNNRKELPVLYNFIEECRTEKGYQLSMPFTHLQLLLDTYPEKIQLFSVANQNKLAAACIAIQVSKDVLYTFYYDHAHSFNAYSPVVLLIEGIYLFCQQQSIRLLDLGTASIDDQPNFSLLDFKLHLGGKPSAKLTFQKEL